MSSKPKYPITVLLNESAEIESYKSEIELVTSLEWFESENSQWQAKVIDKTGARVVLKIEALKLLELEYKHLTTA
ncbi:hypothetical protein [Pseudoalteromonas sp.]|uniref:hypothetical protein n=1 Tax=Pseudoalteromonas sp. TaxID=53249 RepID=UPI003001CC98